MDCPKVPFGQLWTLCIVVIGPKGSKGAIRNPEGPGRIQRASTMSRGIPVRSWQNLMCFEKDLTVSQCHNRGLNVYKVVEESQCNIKGVHWGP